jgi:hypothetical protein
MSGKFIISLDFELMWGVFDKESIDSYGENVNGVHYVLPKLLDIFKKYNLNVTIAIVGFLFYETKKQLELEKPNLLPKYKNILFNPYSYILNNDLDINSGKYFFAPKLIQLLKNYNNIEIASHTFSHYLCLEEGQNTLQFESDLKKMISLASNNGINISSIVFPRNQFSDEYLKICKSNNIFSYRGNQSAWFYKPIASFNQNILTRIFRLIDAYINLSGHNCYELTIPTKTEFPLNIPASRFLRPFNKYFKLFDWLRLRRIKNSMTYAAQNQKIYHLWWHPHNFGKDINENLEFLIKILHHFSFLSQKYNFTSQTMGEIFKEYHNEHE